MAVTLDDLEAAARDFGELEGDNFVDQAQLQRRINYGYRKLWNLVRKLTKGEFFKVSHNFQITSGFSAAMPADFGRLRLLLFRAAGASSTVDQVERVPKYQLEDLPSSVRAYRVMGGNAIEISPLSLAAGYYTAIYEQKFTKLVDATPGPAVNMDPRLEEWEEFPALYAARSSRAKGESEYKQLSEDLAELTAEITELMSDQDTTPDVIADVYSVPAWRERLPPP